jgi:regulator of PEP synthase PpsR (kinase-PPPase family)
MIRNLYVRHRRPVVFDILCKMRAIQSVGGHFTGCNGFFLRLLVTFFNLSLRLCRMSNPGLHHLPTADRTVFFVSDGTGITAETFGHSVLTQFELRFKEIRLPFIDTMDKARDAVRRINDACGKDGKRPIVFSTLVKAELSNVVRQSNGMHMDLIQTFVEPLEQELEVKSTHTVGRSHNIADSEDYKNRIEAINFSLAHDDGQSHKNLAMADVILVGVSRSGKTPTSLYLAMQYGIKAANYPLIPEDFERGKLPSGLVPYKGKIFGLSITPERLAEVRNERRPGSKYAAPENCRYEVNEAEKMMRREGIRWMSSTVKSIEEIATMILQELKSDKRAY